MSKRKVSFRKEAADIADRVIKGIIVSGFENDADAEGVIESQRDMIEDTIRRGMNESVGKVFDGKEVKAVFNLSLAPSATTVEEPIHFTIPPENERGVDFGGWPKDGSVWRHHKSRELYVIRGRSNEDSVKPKYRPTVEYKNWRTGKHFSGRLDDWHRRMTFVGMMGAELNIATLPEGVRGIGDTFEAEGWIYKIESDPSGDGNLALCSRTKADIPHKIFDVEGESLDRLDPAVKAFLEAVGKANGLGEIKGIVTGGDHYIHVGYHENVPGAYTVVSVSLPKGMQLPPLKGQVLSDADRKYWQERNAQFMGGKGDEVWD